MVNKEILTKAIKKAISGGWEAGGYKDKPSFVLSEMLEGQFGHDVFNIFNQDFAKALWPSGLCECGYKAYDFHTAAQPGRVIIHANKKDWRHHLQKMVIAEDPIKYLGEHI
jgi:hypothetical protein